MEVNLRDVRKRWPPATLISSVKYQPFNSTPQCLIEALCRLQMSCIPVLLILGLASASAVTVYRQPHYTTKKTPHIAYTKTLVSCTDQTDQSTCVEKGAHAEAIIP